MFISDLSYLEGIDESFPRGGMGRAFRRLAVYRPNGNSDGAAADSSDSSATDNNSDLRVGFDAEIFVTGDNGKNFSSSTITVTGIPNHIIVM